MHQQTRHVSIAISIMSRKPIRFYPNQRVCVQFKGTPLVFKGTIVKEAGVFRRNGDNEWEVRLDGDISEVIVGDSEMLLLVDPFESDAP